MFRFLPSWLQAWIQSGYQYQPLYSQTPRSPRFKLIIKITAVIALLLFLETIYHAYTLRVRAPTDPADVDRPFQVGCDVPNVTAPRANATILMLARNSDVKNAQEAIHSLERHFNRWYNYPVLFLNNEPWDEHFIHVLTNTTSGKATFDVIPKHMWSFPDWIDEDEARKSIERQKGSKNSKSVNYHHMCRFYSGFFYDVPALQKYKWFWRVEPHVDFSCSITYDPFVEMEKRGKKFSYTVALWEIGSTVPSLFSLVDDFRRTYLRSKQTELWRAMLDAAWVPWPFRGLFSYLNHHDAAGDFWNFCHYWSNFEIADMDWFRTAEYRSFFDTLDRSGGFYFERYGDAPIHSLAAALFLKPSEIHRFEDFGYRHKNFWAQPNNAPGLQIPDRVDLSDTKDWAEETSDGVGCRCEKSSWKTSLETTNVGPTCLRRLGKPVTG